MASLSEMLQYAKFKQAQESGVDTMQRLSDLVKSITEISKQRKKKEKRERLKKIIQKGIETGKLEQEYKISPEGKITQTYKTKKESYADAVNKAKQRIQAGEDYNQVTGELKGKFGSKHTERMDEYLVQFAPEGTVVPKKKKQATRKQIVDLAVKLAQSEGGGFASQDDIKKQIPVAEQMLTGKIGEEDLTGNILKDKQKPYTSEQEQTIQDNMKAYGKTREEVIQALIKKGLL